MPTETSPLLPPTDEEAPHEEAPHDEPPTSKKSWLARHADRFWVSVLLAFFIALVLVYALGANGTKKKPVSKAEMCLSPACVHAASEILYNLAPDYKELDPCEDFEKLVCGSWDDRHDLRPDQGHAFTGTLMSESSQLLLRHILEEGYPSESEHSSFSPAQLAESLSSVDQGNFEKLKNAYDTCMDEDTIKREGIAPLEKILDEIASIFPTRQIAFQRSSLTSNDTEEIADVILYLAKLDVAALFLAATGADDRDPDTVIVAVSSPWRIGLPAKDYYTDDSILKKYEEALVQVMAALYPHQKDARDLAHGVVGFEKQLAAASPDADSMNDVTKYYNPMSLKGAAALTPQIHLSKIINGLAPPDFNTTRVIVMSPDYMESLTSILNRTSKEVLQTYFLWKAIQAFSSEVEAEAVKPYQRFTNELQGKEPDSIPERWRICINHVDDGLGWILSRFFVEKAFSAEAKEFGDQIVSDIKDQFVKKLEVTEWMDKDVIKLAIEKVHKIVQKIGYPTKSPNIMNPTTLRDYYTTVNVTSGTFFANSLSMTRFQVALEWSSLGHPVDRNKWGMTVPTVNAYYNPPGNEIVFPAGIMQFPVFDVDVPQYLSYGAFGSVSGHELSHAFDSTGHHYDQNGNYTDWWTNSTVAAFQDRAECFVNQYAKFTVDGPGREPLHVNGKLTLGENIADAGGVSAAFAAWKSRQAHSHSAMQSFFSTTVDAAQDEDLPGLEHFSHEQLFFVSYANWWCGKTRKETAISRIYVDPHAPEWARILGTMANSRDFRESFGCANKEPVCELW